jgi:hypothetical protein
MNWDGIISLLFFCIELILLVNVLYFGRNSRLMSKGAGLIALLASYQFTEFLICGLDLKYSFAAYIAFLIISFLPPLSLLFVLDLLNKRFPYDRIVFLPAAALMAYYSLTISSFEVVRCSVVYAVYSYPLGNIYGMFYYLPLAVAIILLFSELKTEASLQKKNIKILLFGYILTSLPVIAAFTLLYSGNGYLLSMIESVMCKFALVLALCYAFVVINDSRNNSGERNNS